MEPMRADMVIEAPRHVVWDALVDSDAVVEWNPAIREIQRRSDEPLGMGATRRCFMSPSGWMTETVVEWDEGSLVGYSIRDASPLKHGLIRFELTDQATATRLKASFRYSVRLGPLGPVIDRLIVHRQLTAAWERSLEGLRLYTESLTRKGAGGHTSIPQTAEQGETMTSNTNHALVTGATSGLGLEAAAQLAEAGWAKVTVTGRTEAKAKAASATLAQRTGKDVFSPLALDLNNPASVKTAAAELAANGDTIDFLLLNAGIVPGSELRQTDSGIDVTFSSSLIGHHQLTMQILEDGLLAERAKIVIAGSEAARGDMPTFKVTDLSDASKRYNGDLVATAVSVIRGEEPEKFKAAVSYSNAKLFVAWWSQQLADKLPNGMTVNAISPGSAPETNAGRNANGFMKYVMLPMFKYLPKFLGMKHSVAIGASRYLQALEFGDDVSGEFFASRPKKVTGSLERMKHEHFHNLEAQQAGWKAIVKVSNGIDYPVNA